MSLERVTRALIHLGLSRRDVEIYIHLAVKGPQKARNIAASLRLSKGNTYRALRHLRNLGMVYSCVDRGAEFSAVNFEKAIDLHEQRRKGEVSFLERQKTQILLKWRSLSVDDS